MLVPLTMQYTARTLNSLVPQYKIYAAAVQGKSCTPLRRTYVPPQTCLEGYAKTDRSQPEVYYSCGGQLHQELK